MSIMRRIVRIRDRRVRGSLMLFAFPMFFAPVLLVALLNGRAYTFTFWELHWGIFWAAYDGAFVGHC